MEDWHHLLYVENARIYQPVLEAGLPSAPREAKGLDTLFRHFGLDHAEGRPKILDVSCGIGRHSINLAKLGYEVVGFDFSPFFLRTARRLAKREGLGPDTVRFYDGDTKCLREILESRGEGKFDAIICMDTSIVRPTMKEERALIRSMHEVGRPGAVLVVETANRDNFLKYPIPLPLVQSFAEGRIQRHISATYDARKKHIKGDWKFYRKVRNGDLKHLLTISMEANIHTESELRRLLQRAGWEHLRSYGSVKRLGMLSPDSFHIVMVARRRG